MYLVFTLSDNFIYYISPVLSKSCYVSLTIHFFLVKKKMLEYIWFDKNTKAVSKDFSSVGMIGAG